MTYDITGGNIYFKGQRICAGTLTYTQELKELRAKIQELKKKGGASQEISDCEARIAQLKDEIKRAKFDHKNCDREYAEELAKEVKKRYEKELAKADPSQVPALKKQYADELRIAKKTRLVNQIQMIFQDPIASLNPRMTLREIHAEGLVCNGIREQK